MKQCLSIRLALKTAILMASLVCVGHFSQDLRYALSECAAASIDETARICIDSAGKDAPHKLQTQRTVANTTTGDTGQNTGDVRLYIVNPISKQKILPDTGVDMLPIAGDSANNTIQLTACRGEFESGSFVIRPKRDLTNVRIESSDLSGPNGKTITKNAINLRLVKCWYQAGTDLYIENTIPKPTLVPELLVKDDSIVKLDYVEKKNYLKVKIDGVEKYIDVTAKNAIFPNNAEIHDAIALQPFSVQANTNKQVWITAHIPEDAKSGEYLGIIRVSNGPQVIALINIKMVVLPFELQPPVIEYGLFYRGKLRKDRVTAINSEDKTASQYAIELQDMKDHGVSHPTLYQPFDNMLEQAVSIRKSIGFPGDRLYTLGIDTNNVTHENLAAFSLGVTKWKEFAEKAGYRDLYIYGRDEAEGPALLSQRKAWMEAHNKGVKIFVACYKGAVDLVGDQLDLPILGGSLFLPDDVRKWHNRGKKVFIYGNPQVGVEDPLTYRKNYGFALVCSGYDGAMNYAYQHAFGNSIWNDFDHKKFRDCAFAYPTSDGLIDTVEWEGWREAVDDVRYLTTLAKLTGASAFSAICNVFQGTDDPGIVRNIIIDRILSKLAGAQGPVFSPTPLFSYDLHSSPTVH